MGDLWYPAAKQDEMENAGEFIVGPPPRGVLHTTEGSNYAGAKRAYLDNRSAPHFTVDWRDVYQHIPLDRAARALRPGRGDVETNRWSAIQIEVVAKAANPDWSWETKESTRLLMAWIESQTGIEPKPPEQGFAATSDEAARQRMTAEHWRDWDGWCGHQHVPFNDHWDPGAAPMDHLLMRGIDYIPT